MVEDKYEYSEDALGRREKHPSYGLIHFARRSIGSGIPLFGSSIEHRDTIALTVKHGSIVRGLNNDWFSEEGDIIEVEMSFAQFAEAITSLNNGVGVPCTIRRLKGEGFVPAPKFVNKRTQFVQEFAEDVEKYNAENKQFYEDIKELLDTKKTISKTDREEILRKVERMATGFTSTSEYVAKQFNHQIDETIREAKAEIEAFAQNKLLSIAQQAVVEHGDELVQLQNPVDTTHLTE